MRESTLRITSDSTCPIRVEYDTCSVSCSAAFLHGFRMCVVFSEGEVRASGGDNVAVTYVTEAHLEQIDEQ